MSFHDLVRKHGHLGIISMYNISSCFYVHIYIGGLWFFVAYGENKADVILDADEVLQSWLV